MWSLPLAGGPLDNSPTLFFLAFSLICLRMTSAPGKSASARRLLPKRKRWNSEKNQKKNKTKPFTHCEKRMPGYFLVRVKQKPKKADVLAGKWAIELGKLIPLFGIQNSYSVETNNPLLSIAFIRDEIIKITFLLSLVFHSKSTKFVISFRCFWLHSFMAGEMPSVMRWSADVHNVLEESNDRAKEWNLPHTYNGNN